MGCRQLTLCFLLSVYTCTIFLDEPSLCRFKKVSLFPFERDSEFFVQFYLQMTFFFSVMSYKKRHGWIQERLASTYRWATQLRLSPRSLPTSHYKIFPKFQVYRTCRCPMAGNRQSPLRARPTTLIITIGPQAGSILDYVSIGLIVFF